MPEMTATIEAHSTPMNANSATPAAIDIASHRLPPDALTGGKFADWTKNQPTTPTSSSGTYFRTTVTFWNHAMPRMPPKLTTAGIRHGDEQVRGGRRVLDAEQRLHVQHP